MPVWNDVKQSLRPFDLRGACFVGLVLGLGAFWNGALIIAALLILGAAILWAPHRGDLLMCCAIATVIAILEARFFVSSGPAIVPKPHFGFLSQPPTIRGIGIYYLKLLGLWVPVLVVALVVLRREARWLLISILIPIVFATTFAFTPDVTVNHKFVNTSVRIGAVFVSLIVVRLLDSGRLARAIGIALCVGLTGTGVVDLIGLWNWNNQKWTHNLADPMLQWARSETDPKAVFAAPPVYHHLVYFTGRLSYLGLPYWAESAGYDVPPRLSVLTRIYEGGSRDEIARLARTEGISYVIVDSVARRHYPGRREDTFRQGFPLVFNSGSTQVYALRR